jgi:starvation-inducible DNA-binding protein
MAKSRLDLDDNSKKSMAALLNARLLESLDLKLAIKQAHWNIKGPNFIAVHLMLDEMATRVDGFADDIAERSVALSGIPAGTSQAVAGGSKLGAYPTNITDIKAHLTELAERFAAYGKLTREAIDAADEAGDKDTADLFTGVSRQIDKDLWFLEAHLD